MLKTGCAAPRGDAEIHIETAHLSDVGWLSLLEGKKDHGLRNPANINAHVGVLPLSSVDKKGFIPSFVEVPPQAMKHLLRKTLKYERTCEEKEMILYVDVDNLKPGECVVYRIKHIVNGKIVGGYTVIAKKRLTKKATLPRGDE